MDQAIAHTTLQSHEHSHFLAALPLEWVLVFGAIIVARKLYRRSTKKVVR